MTSMDMQSNGLIEVEKKKKKFKRGPVNNRPIVHYVCVALLVLGIMAVIGIGIAIGLGFGQDTKQSVAPSMSLCPDTNENLTVWKQKSDQDRDVVIEDGKGYLMTGNVTLKTLLITENSRLVIKDLGPNGPPLILRLRHMLIQNGGELWVGAEDCPYQGRLDIVLYGRMDDQNYEGIHFVGRKVLAVGHKGTLEMHGSPKLAWTFLNGTITPDQSEDLILDLADDVSSWQRDYPDIVIASSDYDHEHAEVFSTQPCETCKRNQIKIVGQPQFTHYGEFYDGVDLRAEVGMLTRNVRIVGEVEESCYGFPKLCPFFDRDLFGGQTQVLSGFSAFHVSDIELVNLGQQLPDGNYPIHFHVTGPSYGAYVKRVSIRNTRSRCVTLHGANGVLVEDVVGYDSLGHCFFLEDGNEEDNIFRHNLGLVTRSGSLLPSDRDAAMCAALLDDVWPGYTPDVEDECEGVTSFWVSNPNNTYENNSAAGSEAYGFFVVFHREPSGLSEGTLPPYQSERTPLKKFTNNRAHGNPAIGISIDRGIKHENASEEDGREFLALAGYARFAPHANSDLYAPRVPAVLDSFISYKNAIGAELRGGDIIVQDSSFVDDTVGLTFISENTLPYDVGSHQEVIRTKFMGRSVNFRASENFTHMDPQYGIQLRDGPVVIKSCIFTNFQDDEHRQSAAAIGFIPGHKGHFSSKSFIRNATFGSASRRILFSDSEDSDGDQLQILHDMDGTLAGYHHANIITARSTILTAGCTPKPDWRGAICKNKKVGQIYITKADTTPNNLTISSADGSFWLTGVSDDNEITPTTLTYLTLLFSGGEYKATWSDVAPAHITVRPHNFKPGSSVGLVLCYPRGTTFTITHELYNQLNQTVTSSSPMMPGSSVNDVNTDEKGRTYFWDADSGLLYIHSVQSRPLIGYNYCSEDGCEGITIKATITNQTITQC